MSDLAIVSMLPMAIPDSTIGYLSNSWASCSTTANKKTYINTIIRLFTMQTKAKVTELKYTISTC